MEKFLLGNEILLARCQDIGALPKETLINGGITGPMLRAAGVAYDIRKVEPYGDLRPVFISACRSAKPGIVTTAS